MTTEAENRSVILGNFFRHFTTSIEKIVTDDFALREHNDDRHGEDGKIDFDCSACESDPLNAGEFALRERCRPIR